MNKVFVVDIECTCYDNTLAKDVTQFSDIIQIGVASYDIKTQMIAKEANIYVIPTRSNISYFCTELTGLSPELIDKYGINFADACAQLVALGTKETSWYSCGNFDRIMFENHCRDFAVEYPFSDKHYNIKSIFANAHHTKKQKGMVSMLNHLGINLDGRHHDGLDDAYNTAKIVKWVFENTTEIKMGQ